MGYGYDGMRRNAGTAAAAVAAAAASDDDDDDVADKDGSYAAIDGRIKVIEADPCPSTDSQKQIAELR